VQSQVSVAARAQEKANECKARAQRAKELLKPYESKVRNQRLLQKLSSDLEKEQERLFTYNEKERLIDAVKKAGFRTRERLLANYSALFDRYKRIVSMLQLDEFSKIDEEIVL